MNIAAIIPVHGRHPLLKLTIQRLLNKNRIRHVICVGEEDNLRVCEDAGAMFIQHQNKPIGMKINIGFARAKELKVDAAAFVGSSDWLSDSWFDITAPYLKDNAIVGKEVFNLAHITDSIYVAEWQGYGKDTGRKGELIGIGRVYSGEFLDRINWEPVAYHLNNSLDYSTIMKLVKLRPPMSVLDYDSDIIQSLSISCDKWSNMHSFDRELYNSILNLDPTDWLRKYFREPFS